ncbi:MAG TPA: amino acid permease [Bacilli bacterium]|nr:amino acid permease [Bacilli bacterium]
MSQDSTPQQELARGLKARHILMIALGGAIGAGMFQGSSEAISLAGPGVIFAYLIGGLILLFVMQGLAEMAVRNPQASTFRELLDPILGRFAGYFAGWMYWLCWVLVMATEVTAAGMFLQYWFPDAPLWILSLVISLAITGVNLLNVNVFGETEFWFAGIKVAVLAVFTLLGLTLLFTGSGDQGAVGFTNLTSHGGLFPNGLSGVAAAMLVVMFSFGGTEMIGMTLGETENPAEVVPRAARNVIARILVFYVLPILVIVSLVPWQELGTAQSPFVTVFSSVGIPYVGGIMNFVMLTAVISAANTGMYAASRMLYSQAQVGQAPRLFTVLSKKRVPIRALLASTSFLYVGVIVAFFAKGNTFGYLMTIPGYSILTVWIFLSLAHLLSRRKGFEPKGYYVKWFPLLPLLALLALLVFLVSIVITSPAPGTLVAVGTMVVIAISYLFAVRAKRG